MSWIGMKVGEHESLTRADQEELMNPEGGRSISESMLIRPLRYTIVDPSLG